MMHGESMLFYFIDDLFNDQLSFNAIYTHHQIPRSIFFKKIDLFFVIVEIHVYNKNRR